MSLEQQLRQALREKAGDWSAPPELKDRILSRITPVQGGRRMKKWLIATVVAAVLLVPTGAYAGYTYLADSVYGSQDHFMENGGTLEGYERLEAKLQQAKNSLSQDDFTALTALLHEIGSYNLRIADDKGNLNPGLLSTAEQDMYQELTVKLEPYFEKIEKEAQPSGSGKLPPLDSGTFWEEQLARGEQVFSGTELTAFRQLISELQAYNAAITDSDGSIHPERLSEEETARFSRLYEELGPYLKELGIMIKPRL
ncbi:hypothetical protein R70723_05430 [Paenibacillus sp. FSL R7-0273]|uniref:DUF3600 domain-containing protein n=1 Tax=Paenibacillus sp. FSL R7-0273 TaxID=1536772 RepID=UPI0004F7147A|nr:DUF3600 domain-containing protein [Paenibacillus sp. FSL R7-0273]AIQ45401.1 hypothetical protein R70723_05430 [Paenibacillus sp. FSL R7-0273]OMF89971.1 hypothetical protein BK144_18460 [Paenibacillus sp. FSL R7-0273]